MPDVRVGIKGDFDLPTLPVEKLSRALHDVGIEGEKVQSVLGQIQAPEYARITHVAEQNYRSMLNMGSSATRQKLKAVGGGSLDEFLSKVDKTAALTERERSNLLRNVVSNSLMGTSLAPLRENIGGEEAAAAGGGARTASYAQRMGFGGGAASGGAGMLKRFAGVGLRLAGIGTLAATVGSAVSGAQTEAIGLDKLLRGLDDTTTSFSAFRTQLEQSTHGLALTYQESVGLAQNFAHLSGLSSPDQVLGGARVAEGFARSFGIAPETGVASFGRATFMEGPGGLTPSQLSKVFADAIAASGLWSKGDEVMGAMTQYLQNSERTQARAPDLQKYADLFASMNQTQEPGLRGMNAASVINSMDQALRTGGGAGIAGQNFIWQALQQHGLHIGPYEAEQLEGGGLFATPRQMLAGYKGPGADVTNLDAIRGGLDHMFGKGFSYKKADAFHNLFNIPMPIASTLLRMQPTRAASVSRLIASSGMDINSLNPTGLQDIAHVANTSVMGLDALRKQYLARPGLGEYYKERLNNAKPGGDLRNALAVTAGAYGRRGTEGYQTLSEMAQVKNAITDLGEKLLPLVNDIRNVIVNVLGPVGKDVHAVTSAVAQTSDYFQAGAQGMGLSDYLDMAGDPGMWLFTTMLKGRSRIMNKIKSGSVQPTLNIPQVPNYLNGSIMNGLIPQKNSPEDIYRHTSGGAPVGTRGKTKPTGRLGYLDINVFHRHPNGTLLGTERYQTDVALPFGYGEFANA